MRSGISLNPETASLLSQRRRRLVRLESASDSRGSFLPARLEGWAQLHFLIAQADAVQRTQVRGQPTANHSKLTICGGG